MQVGHIFAFLPDKDARQSFYDASPIVNRAPSVVKQITAINIDGSRLLQLGGGPLKTLPESAPVRKLSLIFGPPHRSLLLAIRVTSTLQARQSLREGLEEVTLNELGARDLPLLETLTLQCRSLRTLRVDTAGYGDCSPLALPTQLPDAFASLSGLCTLQLSFGRYHGEGWSAMSTNHLLNALVACTTIRSLVLSDCSSSQISVIPGLVFRMPHLEHLALGSRCAMEDFRDFFGRPGGNCVSSISSLQVESINVQELLTFLNDNCEVEHFPSLRSLEIKCLEDVTCAPPAAELFHFFHTGAFDDHIWHGKSNSLKISISERLQLEGEGCLQFLKDKGVHISDACTMFLS
ncbi:hypothetical protein DUNSADRAFT_8443 [Dunaliella salina]|uniref:Encoded protein n=1 Tax=Dunaliella salina TaxID=3046 RepID=A0ABQ7GJG0_DUNSA|nr:hypothetical protein DUNSADRAFT_8443 [Dunaliella salina]|eukprot:KAF5834755.1 hypothetical protein DUNSADRAFT_8443 [Dunaliella salina]